VLFLPFLTLILPITVNDKKEMEKSGVSDTQQLYRGTRDCPR
jgi:hypothetical protein